MTFKRYSGDLFVISIDNLPDLEKASMCLYNVLHLPYFINIEVFGKFEEIKIYYVFVKCCNESYDAKIQEEIKHSVRRTDND